VILNVLAWLAVLDTATAIVFAILLHNIARRSRHPLPLRSIVFLAIFLALPAPLLYAVARLLSE
jgi:hypothetical protein